MKEEYLKKVSKNNIINFVKLPEGKYMPLEDIFNLRYKTIITSTVDIRNVLHDVVQIIHHENYDDSNQVYKEVFVYILSRNIFDYREEIRELDFLDIDYKATTHEIDKIYMKNPSIEFEEIAPNVNYINKESESEKALNLLKTVGISEEIRSLIFDNTISDFKTNKDTLKNILLSYIPEDKNLSNLNTYDYVINEAISILDFKDSVRKYENDYVIVFYLEKNNDNIDFSTDDSIIKIRKNDKTNPISIYRELKISDTGIFNCKINEILMENSNICTRERTLLLGSNYYYLSDIKEG